MKTKGPNERLLDDVFSEEIDPAPAASLALVRRLARRRRWSRKARSAGVVVVLLCLPVWIFRGKWSVDAPPPVHGGPGALLEFVTLSLLPREEVVRTDVSSLIVVRTSNVYVDIVTTARAPSVPEAIDDETLLHLAPGAILVQHGTHSAELIFPQSSHLPGLAPLPEPK